MQTYSETLKAHLGGDGVKQERIANEVGCSQASVSRYASGARFPNAEVARAIERATDGAVPFSVWKAEAMERAGIPAERAGESAAAA